MGEQPDDLRELRDEREAARERVGAAYVEGLFDADELEQRMEAIEEARTIAELRTIVADLGGAPLVKVKSAIAVRDHAAAHENIRALFSATERRGKWTPARTSAVRSIFASAVLDLREANLPPGETIFALNVVFGDVEIIAPPGLTIVQDLSAYFASVEEEEDVGEHAPSEATIRITGRVVLGNVSVQRRLPGEGHRDAKRRRKHERKRLAAARQRALPGR